MICFVFSFSFSFSFIELLVHHSTSCSSPVHPVFAVSYRREEEEFQRATIGSKQLMHTICIILSRDELPRTCTHTLVIQFGLSSFFFPSVLLSGCPSTFTFVKHLLKNKKICPAFLDPKRTNFFKASISNKKICGN